MEIPNNNINNNKLILRTAIFVTRSQKNNKNNNKKWIYNFGLRHEVKIIANLDINEERTSNKASISQTATLPRRKKTLLMM